MCRSEPQTPAAVTRTRIWSAPGASTGNSSISNGWPGPRRNAIRPVVVEAPMGTSVDHQPSGAAPGVAYGSTQGRWILLATVLGTGIVFLDATVVNIALPTIGRDLDASLAALQWTVNAYTLTLAGFLLLGGALGDRYGRRRVFVIGVTWFAAASLLCAVAPNVEMLIAARALQGVGGALLNPGRSRSSRRRSGRTIEDPPSAPGPASGGSPGRSGRSSAGG